MIRGKPIISMLEEIGCNLMAKMNNSRNYMEKYSGPITHVAQSKLEKVKKDSNIWMSMWARDPEGSIF